MKIRILSVITATCISVVVLFSCSDVPENITNEKSKSIDNMTEAEKNQANEIADYKKKNLDKIAANDKIIADLKERVNMSKQEARDNYNNRIEVLDKRNAELKAKLQTVEAQTVESWNAFQLEFNHDMQELGHAFENFSKNNVE
jgi:hypothetical protein